MKKQFPILIALSLFAFQHTAKADDNVCNGANSLSNFCLNQIQGQGDNRPSDMHQIPSDNQGFSMIQTENLPAAAKENSQDCKNQEHPSNFCLNQLKPQDDKVTVSKSMWNSDLSPTEKKSLAMHNAIDHNMSQHDMNEQDAAIFSALNDYDKVMQPFFSEAYAKPTGIGYMGAGKLVDAHQVQAKQPLPASSIVHEDPSQPDGLAVTSAQ